MKRNDVNTYTKCMRTRTYTLHIHRAISQHHSRLDVNRKWYRVNDVDDAVEAAYEPTNERAYKHNDDAKKTMQKEWKEKWNLLKV